MIRCYWCSTSSPSWSPPHRTCRECSARSWTGYRRHRSSRSLSAGTPSVLLRLACQPGSRLQAEGRLILATEADHGYLPGAALNAIATGATRFSEISDALDANPTRTLERLIELRLVERITPVTEDERRSKNRIYRIADDFLAFYLGPLSRYQPEIERGLGDTIADALLDHLDDYMGRAYEDAFRQHLRRLAREKRVPVLAGECKWGKRVDASR